MASDLIYLTPRLPAIGGKVVSNTSFHFKAITILEIH